MYDKAKQFTLTRPRLKKAVGGVFLVLGFLALVTPLTPGAAFLLAIGLELVGLRLVFLDRFLKRRSRPAEREVVEPAPLPPSVAPALEV